MEKNGENMVGTLSIIGYKLLQESEKTAIEKLFKVMDESGDGLIGPGELKEGFRKVLKETIADSEAKDIIRKVMRNDQAKEMDWKNFMISTINYTNPKSFNLYLQEAYIQFFNNEQ